MSTGALHSEPPASLVNSERSGTRYELQELLTAEDLAALLEVSKSWIYEHTRSRGVPRAERLPHVKIGKYVRFDARLVRDFLAKRTRIG